MKILIACEESGTVRDAFIGRGHDAVSCGILPTSSPGPHIQGNIFNVMYGKGWDMMIAFYPCTDMAVSGARWFYEKRAEQFRAIQESKEIMSAPIKKISFENPISVLSSKIHKPDQIIQPWMFGHLEEKSTCLWLKGLPLLVPTFDVKALMMCLPKKERHKVHHMPPGPERSRLRSLTYQGIADAMADQWG